MFNERKASPAQKIVLQEDSAAKWTSLTDDDHDDQVPNDDYQLYDEEGELSDVNVDMDIGVGNLVWRCHNWDGTVYELNVIPVDLAAAILQELNTPVSKPTSPYNIEVLEAFDAPSRR